MPAPFTIRPEKIRIVALDTAVADGMLTATGHINEVLYLGMHTRYHVVLDSGGALTVVAQNLDGSSTDALAAQGRQVRLIWPRQHSQHIGDASGT
jgi:putative spermidine/putrescine transport system ATP-binding protein